MTDIVDSKRRSELMRRFAPAILPPNWLSAASLTGWACATACIERTSRVDLTWCSQDTVSWFSSMVASGIDIRDAGMLPPPKSRIAFWTEKFAANVARDARQEAALRALGWRVLVIWACETRRKAAVERRLAAEIWDKGSAPKRKSTPSVAVMEQ